MMRICPIGHHPSVLIAAGIMAIGGLASTRQPGLAATVELISSAGPAGQGAAAATPDQGPALSTAGAKPGSKPAAPTAAPPLPAHLEPLALHDYTGILGKKIVGPDGKELGLVVDVLVDAEGHPRAAVIDFGGFLGVGSRKIAIDWRLLKLTPGQPDWKISLNLDRAEIQAAPEYKPDEASAKIVGPAPKASPLPAKDK